MKSKTYIIDRALHWAAALLLLFMLMNLSTQLHNVDWDIKGQVEHRQDAVEWHAIIGIILLLLTVVRIIFPKLSKNVIPRVKPKSRNHAFFIKTTHIAMYICIGLLVITGIAMINNYEISLHVFGIELAPSRENFFEIFPKFHEIHMLLKQAIWWLIGIHFVGILYAKK
ncbi:cytochrome b/b6 domain-containing protein [Alteromonas sp. ASW11-130]|uniref:cytochrome b/b6 domain-containing protein n=1 Tax=Alteromonas sp. ASW11-130 TaxID=3015775 RepID=UPI002241A92C|nr:cytochrome b/b6 domain-containing protein [Alteromonas sp. ASW11-130]MCW8093309.1 cytochrome b/b6 domain-containing protein [Alteromonas sp. ASW11-130]